MNLTVIAVGVGIVLLGAVAYWGYQERSARGTARRARSGGQTVASGVGIGLVGVLTAFAGFGEGIAWSLQPLGDVVLQHSGVLAQLSIAGVGWAALSGRWAVGATTFVIASALLILASQAFGGRS